MFHQTPSDTIDADAGNDMRMHFEPQHGCPSLVRDILAAQPRSQHCFVSALKFSQISW
jgi:hypothetical protein